MPVLDEWGFTAPNNYINLFFPAVNSGTNTAGSSVVLFNKYRHNPSWTELNYGPLPFTTSSSFSVYTNIGGGSGGSATPTVSGEIPAASWIKGIQFGVTSTTDFNVSGTFPYGSNDIWYTQLGTRLFEVAQYVTPHWTRIAVDVPTGQVQETFQDTVAGGVDQDFGWRRGRYFTAHIPYIHYGYGYGNDSNLPVNTRMVFRYAEQEVSLVQDPQLIFNIVNGITPSHMIEMPVVSNPTQVTQALQQAYGFTGFPVFPRTQQTEAIAFYKGQLANNNLVKQGTI